MKHLYRYWEAQQVGEQLPQDLLDLLALATPTLPSINPSSDGYPGIPKRRPNNKARSNISTTPRDEMSVALVSATPILINSSPEYSPRSKRQKPNKSNKARSNISKRVASLVSPAFTSLSSEDESIQDVVCNAKKKVQKDDDSCKILAL
jgi:hypothetical protein